MTLTPILLITYVLPLIISIVGAYYFAKKDQATVKDFVEIIPYLFIPLVNIIAIVAGAFFLLGDWIENNQSIKNFLNKKL